MRPRIEKTDPPDDQRPPKPGPLQVIHSILAALFGVQSQRNRERDFKHGDARDYILVYVIAVAVLVVAMVVVVNMVLAAAGK